MITGIGTDIIEIARIKKILEEHGMNFLDRVFTSKEKAYCLKYKEPEKNFAGRFAAKEAFVKALGTGFGKDVSWLDIEILNNENGKPEIHLSAALTKKLGSTTCFLSISHCQSYATAVAILET